MSEDTVKWHRSQDEKPKDTSVHLIAINMCKFLSIACARFCHTDNRWYACNNTGRITNVYPESDIVYWGETS